MQQVDRDRRVFLGIWIAATVIKVVIAWRLPLFVDEAFYWQEGRHLAWAYSDLPGLTAWLARLGTELGGPNILALRAPFLLMAALVPWLLIAAARRLGEDSRAWWAGTLAVLMPLSGTLGVLAVPDVPMALASVLCLLGGARLLSGVDARALGLLVLGLVMGALSHYRFVGVIGVGFIALLCLPAGRRALRDPRLWLALAIGALAWWPLLAWNLSHADAGLRFQLVDRHPWSFQPSGASFALVQPLMVTPLLFIALLASARGALRRGMPVSEGVRYYGLVGALSTLAFFVLGFFADVERVSFHWTLPGYFALLVIAPMHLQRWRRGWRIATWTLLGVGLVAMLAYYALASVPAWRERVAGSKHYPYNFAGWDTLTERVRQKRAGMPANTVLLADNFKIGAELGFHLGDANIRVLDHPLNHKHGRAPQLQLWGLQQAHAPAQPTLLVVSSTDVKLRALLAHYQSLCARLGPLPAPEVVNADHGAQRFLLFALDGRPRQGACVAPAIAYLNAPAAGATLARPFEVRGWATKEGVGVSAVTITLNGTPVAQAQYGLPETWIHDEFFGGASRDPNGSQIAFRAQVDARHLPAGRYWFGVQIQGGDGSRETWAEQSITLR